MVNFRKEFYVDEYDLENMSCFTVSRHPVPMRDRTLKITISYEIDREITIKESELEKMCDELYLGTAKFKNTSLYFKLKEGFFGGGEND